MAPESLRSVHGARLPPWSVRGCPALPLGRVYAPTEFIALAVRSDRQPDAREIETGSQLEFKISRVAAASSAVPVATSELSVIVQKTASFGGETGTESIDDPQFKAFPRRADNR